MQTQTRYTIWRGAWEDGSVYTLTDAIQAPVIGILYPEAKAVAEFSAGDVESAEKLLKFYQSTPTPE